MPANWESSGRVKIERAKEHINDLHALATAFFEAKSYRVAFEKDPGTGQLSLVVRGGPIPLRWSAIASDAVHNLRSSLDHLWRRVMYPNGGSRGWGDNFPIRRTSEEFEARCGRRRDAKTPRKAAMELVRRIKPYLGGNDALYYLDAIDNRNKHEILTLACCTFNESVIETPAPIIIEGEEPPPNVPSMVRLHPTSGRPLRVEDGTPLIRFSRYPSKVHVKIQTTFGVAFGEGEILEGEPVVPTLYHFAGVVEGITEAFISAGLLAAFAVFLAP